MLPDHGAIQGSTVLSNMFLLFKDIGCFLLTDSEQAPLLESDDGHMKKEWRRFAVVFFSLPLIRLSFRLLRSALRYLAEFISSVRRKQKAKRYEY